MKTIDWVKNNLPFIYIEHNGKKELGQVLGRKLDFPFVYIRHLDVSIECSWQMVTRCYNDQNQ